MAPKCGFGTVPVVGAWAVVEAAALAPPIGMGHASGKCPKVCVASAGGGLYGVGGIGCFLFLVS